MPRRMTFNPLTLKTGQHVFWIAHGENFSKPKLNIFVVEGIVVEVLQTMERINNVRVKRNFKIVIQLMRPMKVGNNNNEERIVVNEETEIFMSAKAAIDNCIRYSKLMYNRTKAHENRSEQVGDIKFIKNEIE